MGSTGDIRGDNEAGTLVGPAWSLRWRAPELALLLGERASTWAARQGDEQGKIRAETAVVLASCRLGQRLTVIDRAIEATRAAERHADADAAAALRIELAGCAAAAGVPAIGGVVLRPLLSSVGTAPSVRAAALVRLVECLAHLGQHAQLDTALAQADEFYGGDHELDLAERVVRRAVLRAVAAGTYRRRGNPQAALDAARDGADLLDGLSGAPVDGGAARARVTEQAVSSLLDLGRTDEALAAAHKLLDQPVRAPAAAATGWLALSVAVRAHVPADEHREALALLGEAAALARRHRLDDLHAESLSALAEAHERADDVSQAVACLRDAQVIRLRQVWARHSARTALLAAFGEARHPEEFMRLLVPSPQLTGSPSAPSQRPFEEPVRRRVDEAGRDLDKVTDAAVLDPALDPGGPAVETAVPAMSSSGRPSGERPSGERPSGERTAVGTYVTTTADPPMAGTPADAADASVNASHGELRTSAFSAFAAWSPTAESEAVIEVPAPVHDQRSADGGDSTSSGPRHSADVAANVRELLASLGVSVGRGGRRRARHADDDEPVELAGSRHDSSLNSDRVAEPAAPIGPSSPRSLEPDAGAAPVFRSSITAMLGDTTDVGDPPRTDAGLGDLLSEALRAYQDAQGGTAVPDGTDGRFDDFAAPAESAQRSGRVTPLTARKLESDSVQPATARHRTEDRPTDSQWMPPHWGSPAS